MSYYFWSAFLLPASACIMPPSCSTSTTVFKTAHRTLFEVCTSHASSRVYCQNGRQDRLDLTVWQSVWMAELMFPSTSDLIAMRDVSDFEACFCCCCFQRCFSSDTTRFFATLARALQVPGPCVWISCCREARGRLLSSMQAAKATSAVCCCRCCKPWACHAILGAKG